MAEKNSPAKMSPSASFLEDVSYFCRDVLEQQLQEERQRVEYAEAFWSKNVNTHKP